MICIVCAALCVKENVHAAQIFFTGMSDFTTHHEINYLRW